MFGHSATAPTLFEPTPPSVPPPNVRYRMKLPAGLPVNTTPLNPIQFLLRAALIQPDKIAIRHPDVEHAVEYSYTVWAQRIQNLAYGLLARGIAPGDRVAVIAPNCPLIAEAHHAAIAARAVVLCINIRLQKSDVEYILEHSGAKLILVDHEFANLVHGTNIPVIVSHDTGRFGDPYEDFLAHGRAFSNERGWEALDLEPDENANCALNYTSGTTGRPKGVMTTLRGSYLAAISNAYESRLNRESVYLWIAPMFHASGWTFPWSCTFAQCTQVTTRYVRPSTMWTHFLHSGVTHYCGAPTVQIGVVNAKEAKKLPHGRHIAAIVAGSAPTASLLASLESLGFSVNHVYGLTETYGPFTRNYDSERPSTLALPLHERAKIMARQGHAFANADEVRVARIHQKSGHEHSHDGDRGDVVEDVPDDGETVGEVVVRGNIVMKELVLEERRSTSKVHSALGLTQELISQYFNDPGATEKAFRGGYFGSGDLAVRNSDGSISIKDRSKDLIISGGENASSLAVEQELAAHPDVLEVSVVARPHSKWGERPMAFVILNPQGERRWKGKEEAFERELKTFARGRLPGFASPEWVAIVHELPKTSTGKIQKHVLRGRAAKL